MSVLRLLLIEDDPAVRELAHLVLTEAGFSVEVLDDGPAASETSWDDFSVVVLDLGLPSIDGVDLSRRIRDLSNVPIVILTARDQTEDVVTALETGADDYVTKPFVPEVLAARARAAARRRPPGSGGGRLSAGDLVIDQRASRAFIDESELDLSGTEMRLLVALVSQAGQVLNRQQLLEEVWGYDYLGDSRLVDMAILRLRAKLREGSADDQDRIVTVRGQGYRLDAT